MIRMLLISAALAAAVAGCAAPSGMATGGVAPGTTREQVLARLGQPTRTVPIEGGTRLQYSQQPRGQYAYMVDLDASGKVVRSRQVLNAIDFNRIVPGTWTRADVEREFGPPAQIDRVASWNGPILVYRWYDGSDMFYYMYLDANNVVQRAHPAMEFHNTFDKN